MTPKINHDDIFVGTMWLSSPAMLPVLKRLGVAFTSIEEPDYRVRVQGDVLEKIMPLWGSVKWDLEAEDLEYQKERRRR